MKLLAFEENRSGSGVTVLLLLSFRRWSVSLRMAIGSSIVLTLPAPLSAFAARKAIVGVPIPPTVASDSTPINDIDFKNPQASREHGRSQTNERPKKRKRALQSRTSFKTHVESQRKENTIRPSRRVNVDVEVTSGEGQPPETTSDTISNSDSEQVGQVLLIPCRSL